MKKLWGKIYRIWLKVGLNTTIQFQSSLFSIIAVIRHALSNAYNKMSLCNFLFFFSPSYDRYFAENLQSRDDISYTECVILNEFVPPQFMLAIKSGLADRFVHISNSELTRLHQSYSRFTQCVKMTFFDRVIDRFGTFVKFWRSICAT